MASTINRVPSINGSAPVESKTPEVQTPATSPAPATQAQPSPEGQAPAGQTPAQPTKPTAEEILASVAGLTPEQAGTELVRDVQNWLERSAQFKAKLPNGDTRTVTCDRDAVDGSDKALVELAMQHHKKASGKGKVGGRGQIGKTLKGEFANGIHAARTMALMLQSGVTE